MPNTQVDQIIQTIWDVSAGPLPAFANFYLFLGLSITGIVVSGVGLYYSWKALPRGWKCEDGSSPGSLSRKNLSRHLRLNPTLPEIRQTPPQNYL